MTFHDSTKIAIVSKHQNEFKNLDESVIFQVLKPLQPQQPRWPQWTLETYFIKKIAILMVWSSLAPTWPKTGSFSGMDHQKSKYSLISEPFLSEAVKASQCYFFENWPTKLWKLTYYSYYCFFILFHNTVASSWVVLAISDWA